MEKIKKGLTLKILSIVISITLLFTKALYPSSLQKESLRIQIGTRDDTYQRINGVDDLSSDTYKKFRLWLKKISQDKLEKTVVFLDALESIRNGLTDDLNRDVHRTKVHLLEDLAGTPNIDVQRAEADLLRFFSKGNFIEEEPRNMKESLEKFTQKEFLFQVIYIII